MGRTDTPRTTVRALGTGGSLSWHVFKAAGLAVIDKSDPPLRDVLSGYHLMHAARADLLRRLGRDRDAAQAYRFALAHVGSVPERRFLERRLAELSR